MLPGTVSNFILDGTNAILILSNQRFVSLFNVKSDINDSHCLSYYISVTVKEAT